MVELPPLDAPTKRKLELKWLNLLEQHRLTAKWIDAYASSGEPARRRATDRVPQDTRGKWLAEWLLQYQSARIDTGISQSIDVAKGRFNDLASEYWGIWESSGWEYEAFAAQIELVKGLVQSELASIWSERSPAACEWYEKGCAPAVDQTLAGLVQDRIREARRAELYRLYWATKETNPSETGVAAAGDALSNTRPEDGYEKAAQAGSATRHNVIELTGGSRNGDEPDGIYNSRVNGVPRRSVDAITKCQQSQAEAVRNLDRALRSYLGTLLRDGNIDPRRLVEIWSEYAVALYDALGESFEGVAISGESAFGEDGVLAGGPTLDHVERDLKDFNVPRPENWPAPDGTRAGKDAGQLREPGSYATNPNVSFGWLLSEDWAWKSIQGRVLSRVQEWEENATRAGLVSAFSNLGTALQHISPDDPNYEIWKAFCHGTHKAEANWVSDAARRAKEGQGLDPAGAYEFVLKLFDTAVDAQIELVTDLNSVACCEAELRTLLSGSLDYLEKILAMTGSTSEIGKWRPKLELELIDRLGKAKVQALEAAEAASPETLDTAQQPAVAEGLTGEPLKAERERRLVAARERWRPTAGREIPFTWIHAAAGVDHKDAYDWKNGKLPASSTMSKSIDRVLKQSTPPTAPTRD